MNPIDLFIIYLACGAPFGVYYFTQHRTPNGDAKTLWFKTLLNFLFWLPYAFLLLRRSIVLNFYKTLSTMVRETNLHSLKKQLEKFLPASDSEISVYEFREIVERYVGLTIANRTEAAQIADADKEFFRAARNQNHELGAICSRRRNRKRLARHQTEAGKDFLNLVARLSETVSDAANLKRRSIELADYLKDFETREKLESLFADKPQTANQSNVPEDTEKILWKPATAAPKPSPAELISYQLPNIEATLNFRSKD